MAKSNILVKCTDCLFCSGIQINYLTDCSNKEANPKGHKKGLWAHPCDYFKKN